MPSNKSLKLSLFDYCLFSFFGTGKSPWAPGTVASIFSAFILYVIYFYFPSWELLIAITSLIFFISYFRMKIKKNLPYVLEDPGWIVIDEFLGVALGMSIMAYFQFLYLSALVYFVLFFRFFDITKIFPANIFNNRKGAFPLIADDLVSGIYAVICTYFVCKIVSL
jgi:phosphatidylglycerophosphatase A